MTVYGTEFVRAHQAVVEASLTALSAPAQAASRALISALDAGGRLICFGNGGSAAQASHMAGELAGRYDKARRPLPAMSLSADAGTVTCISNDFGYEALFERQIEAFANPGDIALGLTTSGNSANVIRALNKARSRGATTIALTGAAGLNGAEVDHLLAVPSSVTAHVQEVHLMILHLWCMDVDKVFAEG